jgi:putative zinc finger/helix-turn-helix YgiT family protein
MAEKEHKPAIFPRRCPECGKTEVYRETINYKTAFKYEGHLHEFEAQGISVNKCRACGNISLPNTALDQITEAFRRHAHLLTAQYILDEIQKLQLTQKDFAELLGVAPETVSRWLTNVQIQTRSLDRLMRLFFKSAELRKDLAEMNGEGPIEAEGKASEDALTPTMGTWCPPSPSGRGETAAIAPCTSSERGEQILVIRGRVQKGVVVLEAASVPEGTEVAVVVPIAPQAVNETMPEAERQRVLQIMDRIAALPDENPGDTFSGADHDRVLYGAP